jgi:hypothetical protein
MTIDTARLSTLAIALCVATLTACGSADYLFEPEPATPPVVRPNVPPAAPICTDVVDGRKVTYYCDAKGAT